MVPRYLNELADGSHVDATFFLKSRELRTARTGDAFLSMEVSDRTGSMSAVLFRPSVGTTAIPVGSAVNIRGQVAKFHGNKRILVEQLTPSDEWNVEELMGSAPRPIPEMREELSGIARSIHTKTLRRLVRQIFSDAGFLRRFCEAPGSESYHHAYCGGLLEHTLSVASICGELSERYEGIDRDLLITAALLHDVGKTQELSSGPGFSYTDEGRMIGHVMLGVLMVHRAAESVDIPPDVLTRLEHAILSHHGELEWGSPKQPCTYEALLLHHADNLDAKAGAFAAIVKGASRVEESWTERSNVFHRPLYSPRFPEAESRNVSEDEQHFMRTA